MTIPEQRNRWRAGHHWKEDKMSDDLKARIAEARAQLSKRAYARREPLPPRQPLPDGKGGHLYHSRPGRTYTPREGAK